MTGTQELAAFLLNAVLGGDRAVEFDDGDDSDVDIYLEKMLILVMALLEVGLVCGMVGMNLVCLALLRY